MMKEVKEKISSPLFKKALGACFLYCLLAFTCFGYSSSPNLRLKDSIGIKNAADTLAVNDTRYFNRFFLRKNRLVYPFNRFYNFTRSSHPYTIEVTAPFSPGCLCLGDPLFVRASLNNGPIQDIVPSNLASSQWYYNYGSYTTTISPDNSLMIRDLLDEPLSFIPEIGRGYIKDILTNHIPNNYAILKNGPITTSTVNSGNLVFSFGQSAMDMVRLMLTLSGQEMYLPFVEGGGTMIKMVIGALNSSGLKIPNPWDPPSLDPFFRPIVNEILSGSLKPIGYSVPIDFYTEHEHNNVTAFAPYTRPVYKKPKPISTTIEVIPSESVYIKPWSVAKHSLYVPYEKSVKFMANLPYEDPADGVVNYKWLGFPSITGLGFGRAIDAYSGHTDPFTIKMDKPFWQSGLYGLIAYRGPIPPIGCMKMSEWTEINVGCDPSGAFDYTTDKLGLIKLQGQDDFYERNYIKKTDGEAKRLEPYAPIVCDGENVTLVSGGVDSNPSCYYTYEWYFSPGSTLKKGTTDEYEMVTPSVLIGDYKNVEVDILNDEGKPSGTKSTIKRPVESNETITIPGITPEQSGVYTRMAIRTGLGHTFIPDALCGPCFRKAQLMVTVKPSLPKLMCVSPVVCEGGDLVIAISPTTDNPTEYQWAHESNPSQWSDWSSNKQIIRRNVTTDMSGVYLVKTREQVKERVVVDRGLIKKNSLKVEEKEKVCTSVHPVTITVEVKPKVHISLSLSEDVVYVGRGSILTASLSGTTVAPEGGITITIKEGSGGSAIKDKDYEPLSPQIYIPANTHSASITIATKWTKPTTGDPAKILIIAGNVINSISTLTCYADPKPVTLTIQPLFKPEITNDPVSRSICSGEVVNIELSSTLAHTTYHWTARNETGDVTSFSLNGSSSIIHEQLINNSTVSSTVVYTITPQIADPEDPSLYIDGETKSLSVTVIPMSNKIVVVTKQTSVNTFGFDWLPESSLQDNVTYRWYTQADKTGGILKEGKGRDGVYSISTAKPRIYTYYVSTQEDGYCENEPTKIELIALHHIQLAFDRNQLQQGEKAILTVSLSGSLVAPDDGITITLHQVASSAKKGIHYDGLLPTIYIPKGSKAVSITISTPLSTLMEADKVLIVNGQADNYIIEKSAALTITRNPNNNIITLAFDKQTVDGEHIAKLTAALPPTIIAQHPITIYLNRDDYASTAMENEDYVHLKPSITILTGENSSTIDVFMAKNNCVIGGSKVLTLEGGDLAGYKIKKPNPTITILDKTGDNLANKVITLDFQLKEVRGGETDRLNICLPHGITSVQPIHIKLSKKKSIPAAQVAKKNINYRKFLWDVTIPANTTCTSILVHTLLDRISESKTLGLTGYADGYRLNSDKVTIITPKITVPNTFSPNGDGDHDTWEIHSLDLYRDCDVTVYNRWNELVFGSYNGYFKPWDGTNNGRPLPSATYYYKIDLKDGGPILRGYVAIIR